MSNSMSCRIKCDVDDKEFKKMCSVKVMVERLETKSWFIDTETDEDEEKKAVLGLEDKDSQRSSTFCGESIPSTISQSTSFSVYSSDVSFIDDNEESCEDFFYGNPYCSENSTPKCIVAHFKRIERKPNVMSIDSDDSIEEVNKKVNRVMKRKKRVPRIESDESSESDIEIKKQVASIESDESSESDIEIKKRVARIESDESSQSEIEIIKRVARIESDESSESDTEIDERGFTH